MTAADTWRALHALLAETTPPADDFDAGTAARMAPGRYPPDFSRDLAEQPMPDFHVFNDRGQMG